MEQVNAYIINYTLKDYNDVKHDSITLYHTTKSGAVAMFKAWAKKGYIGAGEVVIDNVKQNHNLGGLINA